MKTSSSRRAAEIVALLQRGHKSRKTLIELLGVNNRQAGRVQNYLDELHDLGAIYIVRWDTGGRWSRGDCPVYGMQRFPFQDEDAPKPLRSNERPWYG